MKIRFLYAILFVLSVLAAENNVAAQDYSVTFAYDSKGNQITRVLTLNEEKSDGKEVLDSMWLQSSKNFVSDSFKEMKVRLYPNPTSGKFSIVITSSNTEEILVSTLYTVAGLLLVTKRQSGDICEFDISQYPSGTYFLKMEIAGESQLWKIIKP